MCRFIWATQREALNQSVMQITFNWFGLNVETIAISGDFSDPSGMEGYGFLLDSQPLAQ